MIPYFLLLLIPALCSFLDLKRKENGRYILHLHTRAVTRSEGLMMPVFWGLLLLLLMCRGEAVGRDLPNYHRVFDSFQGMSLENVCSTGQEPLFRLPAFALRSLTGNYQVFLAAVALAEVLPLACVYSRNRRHSFVQIAVFLNLPTFVMLFSGLRQAMAISAGVLAFDCLCKNRKAGFFLLAAAAALVHTSGFVVLALYPLCRLRLKRRDLWYLVPAIVLIFVCNRQIFGVLSRLYARIYDRFQPQAPSGAFGSLVLFSLFAGFLYLVSDEARMDQEAFALRNILLLAVALQCFAPLHTLAMRVNYYFIIFIPMALGKCLSVPRKRFARISKWGEAVLCGFFVLYYGYTVCLAGMTGRSALDTIPYVPFWAD